MIYESLAYPLSAVFLLELKSNICGDILGTRILRRILSFYNSGKCDHYRLDIQARLNLARVRFWRELCSPVSYTQRMVLFGNTAMSEYAE